VRYAARQDAVVEGDPDEQRVLELHQTQGMSSGSSGECDEGRSISSWEHASYTSHASRLATKDARTGPRSDGKSESEGCGPGGGVLHRSRHQRRART
jgi:hypothetical protein